MAEHPFNILFLSNRNTARSIFAEAVVNRNGRGRFIGYSAGLSPASELDPVVLDILQLSGYSTESLRPKSWKEFTGPDTPPLDFVFTLCDLKAGEAVPHWPSRPVTADWSYPDPEAMEGEDWERRKALSETLAGLERQFGTFSYLPFEALDDMSLRQELAKMQQPARA